MKLRARGSDKGDLLSGRIELDPGGERAPWVTLDDGTRLGSLVDILDRFSVEEVSSEENDVIREAILGRGLKPRRGTSTRWWVRPRMLLVGFLVSARASASARRNADSE